MLARTDAKLVEAACDGDVSSFGELYQRHYKAVVGVAYCATSDRHLAEDAAQDAFAVACRDLFRLRQPEKFASWIAGICRKTAQRLAKKQRLRQPLPDDVAAADNHTDADENRAIVRQAVSRLSGSAKEVIVLYYFSGLSHQQIAATLGVSTQAVHGRLIRARRKLGEDLTRSGIERRDT